MLLRCKLQLNNILGERMKILELLSLEAFPFFYQQYRKNAELIHNNFMLKFDHGYTAAVLAWSQENSGVYIRCIEVAVKYRGKGYCRKMLTEFIEEHKNETITVLPYSQDLVSMYEKFGFVLANDLNLMERKVVVSQ